MELKQRMTKPPSPFKFHVRWLKEVEFREIIERYWISHDVDSPMSTSIQFNNNLKRLKSLAIPWIPQNKVEQYLELIAIEESLEDLHTIFPRGYEFEDKKREYYSWNKKEDNF